MWSRKIEDLSSELQEKHDCIISFCAEHGVDMLTYCTLRGANEQAIAFRKSRTKSEITHKADELLSRGFSFLADVLWKVGPQAGDLGKHVTNAGPGESWHQYGMAFDAVPLRDGKCCWDKDTNRFAWAIYREAIFSCGCSWGGGFGDYPHCQQIERSNPLDVLTAEQVKRMVSL